MPHVIIAFASALAAIVCVASDSIWVASAGGAGKVTVVVAVASQWCLLLAMCLDSSRNRLIKFLISLIAFASFVAWAQIAFLTGKSFGVVHGPRDMASRVFLLSMICFLGSLILFDHVFRLSRKTDAESCGECKGDGAVDMNDPRANTVRALEGGDHTSVR